MLSHFPISARLPAADIDRARLWYSEKLGLAPSGETMGNLWYEAGGTWFLLYKTSSAGTAKSTAAGARHDYPDPAADWQAACCSLLTIVVNGHLV